MTPTLLAVTMAVYLEDATPELWGRVPPEELYPRFLNWIRS